MFYLSVRQRHTKTVQAVVSGLRCQNRAEPTNGTEFLFPLGNWWWGRLDKSWCFKYFLYLDIEGVALVLLKYIPVFRLQQWGLVITRIHCSLYLNRSLSCLRLMTFLPDTRWYLKFWQSNCGKIWPQNLFTIFLICESFIPSHSFCFRNLITFQKFDPIYLGQKSSRNLAEPCYCFIDNSYFFSTDILYWK